MQVLEAMLTGESVPISKNLVPVKEASGLGDRKCMAFSATTVSAGQGLGVVVATGEGGGRLGHLGLKQVGGRCFVSVSKVWSTPGFGVVVATGEDGGRGGA